MSYRVTCVRCGQEVRIPRDLLDRWVTCPRCLASIPNPGLGMAAGPSPPAAIPAAEMPAPVESASGRECPECGQSVEPAWRYCPHCDAALGQRLPPIRLDAEVGRDLGMVGGGLAVLALLGGLGMILFYCGGGMGGVRTRSEAENAAGVGLIVGVILFGVAVLGTVLAGLARRPGARIGSVVLGAVAIGVAVLAIVVAGMVYTFAGCFEPCGPRRRGEIHRLPGEDRCAAGGRIANDPAT